MDRMEAINWVQTVCCGLRRSQAKTLSHLVAAALTISRVSLAEIGRQLTNTTAKHGIKRTWRFTANKRIEISDAMSGVVKRLLKRKRKKPLVISLDWVEVRQFHTLAICAAFRGRSVPLLWASYREWDLHKSQNNLEEGLLRLLRQMIPNSVPLILLGDRGFGRTELARLCQGLGIHYVIRISPDVWVRSDKYQGKLLDFPVKKGICRCLRNVEYRSENPVIQHVVIRWKQGLPKKRDECWFLMTDLEASAVRISDLYAQRMTIEQFFRDQKSRRNGFALRNILIKKPAYFDRLLLILVLVYILLIGLGLRAERYYCPSNWCTNTRSRECSVFVIGQRMLDKVEFTIDQIIQAIQSALTQPVLNWG